MTASGKPDSIEFSKTNCMDMKSYKYSKPPLSFVTSVSSRLSQFV